MPTEGAVAQLTGVEPFQAYGGAGAGDGFLPVIRTTNAQRCLMDVPAVSSVAVSGSGSFEIVARE